MNSHTNDLGLHPRHDCDSTPVAGTHAGTAIDRESELTGESGIALLLAILMLLMISAIGVSALNRAGDESIVAGASRRKLTNVAAAEAALKIVGQQLQAAQASSSLSSPPLNLADFVVESNGSPISIRSGTIDNPTALPINPVGVAPDKGGDLRMGKETPPRLIYRINVVASDRTGGNAQLQAQYAVRQN